MFCINGVYGVYVLFGVAAIEKKGVGGLALLEFDFVLLLAMEQALQLRTVQIQMSVVCSQFTIDT